MPWQRDLFDVALEIDDNGHFVYREVRFSVPRQTGKSLTLLIRALLTARRVKRSTTVFTAQTGQVARDRISLDWGPQIMELPSLGADKLFRANGSERIEFLNGSKILAVANSLSSGHGLIIDLSELDECFAMRDLRLINSLRPAMITKIDAQSWLCSTAGTLESEVWRSLVDDGRSRCETNTHGRVCYLEFSAPDDADPEDTDVWRACSPALGYTIDIDTLRSEFETMPIDSFKRAFLNMWTATESALIPPQAWANCYDPISQPEGVLHLALDVAPGQEGGRSTAFAVCGSNRVIEIVDYRPGVGWAIARLKELDARHSFGSISVDSVGPVRSLLNEIEDVVGRSRLRILSTSDACAAAGRLHQAILEAEVLHRGQPPLDQAVAGAAKRFVGDAWVFGRRVSSTDVSPLVAAALAHHAAVDYGNGELRIY